DFKIKRAGRDPKDWSKSRKGDDAELRTKLRAKMYELLGIGSPENPDFKPLQELMVLPEDADTALARQEAAEQAAAVEQQEQGAGTFYDTFKADQGAAFLARLRAAYGPNAPMKEGITKNFFADIAKRGTALLAGLEGKQKVAFVSAMKDALEAARPANGLEGKDLAVAEVEYLRALRQFFLRAEQAKALLGDTWATTIGLVTELGRDRFRVDQGKMDTAVTAVKDGATDIDYIDAFSLTEGANQAKVLAKIEPAIRGRITALNATDKQMAEVALLAIPGEPHTLKSVDINRRVNEVILAAEKYNEGTWEERLVKLNLATLESDELIYDVRAIRKLMNQAKGAVERLPASAK
ncbi:MAG: hypothetical protein ACD_43C00193G0001, partial [uncultured bacterium]